MGKGSSSPPPPPDPAKTAQAQAAASKEAIQESSKLNAIDIYGPGGSTTYQRRPDGTPYAQTVNLNPAGEDIFNTQQFIARDLSGQAYGMVDWLPGEQFNLGGVNYDPNSYGDLSLYDQGQARAIYDRSLQFLEPQFEQDRALLHNRLVQQGFQPGNEAYETAMGNYGSRIDQARLAAAQDAEIGGRGAAQQRIQAEQGLRGQTINERLMERQQPFNELSAYLQGSPVFQQPQATGVQPLSMQAPDVMGATYNSYQGALNSWNAQQQQNAGMWGNIAGLGAAAIPAIMSDENQKEDIRPLGKGESVLDRLRDMEMSSWQYRPDSPAYDGGQPHIGPMAQDVRGAFGIGNGTSIPAGVPTNGQYPDAFGLTLAAVKELDRKLEQRTRRAA